MADGKSARDRRLAEALRANLHRRKSQSRARGDEADPARPDASPSDSGEADSDETNGREPNAHDEAGSNAAGDA